MTTNVSSAIESIEKCLREASNYFLSACYNRGRDGESEDDGVAGYFVEKAFIELLILLEHLGLVETHRTVVSLFESAKSKGFEESEMGPEEPYLLWNEKIRMYLDGISSVHGLRDSSVSELRDLKKIVKRCLYAICNKSLFPKTPSKEADVHDRIEAILKCHFSDLKRKPALSKPIKNFEPDSGIPSTKTLIEYKFVTNMAEAKRVVDEILADTSGYRSAQWKNLLFVIYETHRVMPEEDWTELLRECGLGSNYDAVVLSGLATSGG
jgi:hypothetical protein